MNIDCCDGRGEEERFSYTFIQKYKRIIYTILLSGGIIYFFSHVGKVT